MIKSFRDINTQRLFEREIQKGILHDIEDQIYYKLLVIHTAGELRDLGQTPGNRLEKLKGDRRGQHSIRVGDQWRICFLWKDGNAHPGDLLRTQFLEPLGITTYRLAKEIGVDYMRIKRLLDGSVGITADTALRLSVYFGTTPELWMNMQTYYNLELAKDDLEESGILKEIKPLTTSA